MLNLLLSALFLLPPNHPMLSEKSVGICPCHIQTDEVQNKIDRLRQSGFAVAAPEIGILDRILRVENKIYINPEIIWKSEETVLNPEGCTSTYPIYALVLRHQQVLVRAYDEQANLFTDHLENHKAFAMQHAMDHLDGIRPPDRVTNERHLHFVYQPEHYYGDLLNWPYKASKQEWEALKHHAP